MCARSLRRTLLGSSSPNGWTGNDSSEFHLARVGVPVLELDRLGQIERQAQAVGHVVGHVPARHRQDGRVPHRAVDEDRQVGRAAADVHHHHAHLALGRSQDHVPGRQRVQDEAVHVHPGRFDALLQVLDGRRGGRDDVCLHLQAEAVHAQRAAHALVAIQIVAARNDVQHLAVVRDGDGARVLDGALHVLVLHGPHAADPGDTPAVDRRDLIPGHAHERAPDLVAAAALRLVHGGRDRRRQGVHVRDDAFLHAAARLDAQPHHVEVFLAYFTDDGTDLGRADVDSDH